MCLGGLYKAGRALFNWKRPNGCGGQPHITANSYFKIGRTHMWSKCHSFGGVHFERWHTVDMRRLLLIGWLAFDDHSDWLWLAFLKGGQFGQWAILARISHLAITLLSRLCSSNCPLLSSSKHHRYCWHWSHLVGSGGGISVNINVVTIFPPKSFSNKWGLELVHTQPDTSFTQT